jgi:hypothetical protein
MCVREIGWSGMDWIELAQDKDQWRAVANTVMNLMFASHFGKFWSSRVTGGFSRRSHLCRVSWSVSHSVSQSASQ